MQHPTRSVVRQVFSFWYPLEFRVRLNWSRRNGARATRAARAHVEELLRNHENAGSFLSKPVLEQRNRESREAPLRFVENAIIASRFKIVRLLGKGGMGEVFEAEDLNISDVRWR